MKPPPSPLADLAESLKRLADWADRELAGGAPPKYVAESMADSLRYLAAALLVMDAGE